MNNLHVPTKNTVQHRLRRSHQGTSRIIRNEKSSSTKDQGSLRGTIRSHGRSSRQEQRHTYRTWATKTSQDQRGPQESQDHQGPPHGRQSDQWDQPDTLHQGVSVNHRREVLVPLCTDKDRTMAHAAPSKLRPMARWYRHHVEATVWGS